MNTRSKGALLAAALALLIMPLAGGPVSAAPGTVECSTTAIVTSQHSGVNTPRPLLSHADDHWSTLAQVVYACAGGINGFAVVPGTSTANPQHCAPGTLPASDPGHGGSATDDALFTALCANPVVGLRPSHVQGNNSATIGTATCSWTTIGHAQFAGVAIASLDLAGFTCSNGFGGADAFGHSHSLAALLFNPVYNVTGECPAADVCWLNAVSQGQISVVDPS